MITKVIEEMVKMASQEVGYEYTQESTDHVLHMLEKDYDIIIDDDGPINWQVMNVISLTVREWQRDVEQVQQALMKKTC